MKRCTSCCSCIAWNTTMYIFGFLSLVLGVLGVIVMYMAFKIGENRSWFYDMVKDAGMKFKEGSDLMDNMYDSMRGVLIAFGILFIIYGLSGICLLYLKRCYCVCMYGFCFALLWIFALGVAIPTFGIWGMKNETIAAFCKNDFDAIPFGYGKYFEEHPDMSARRFDIMLNGPSKILCTDACPCAPIDMSKWSVAARNQMQNTSVANTVTTVNSAKERSWNFTGKITSLTQCVEYLGSTKAETKDVTFALDTVANKEVLAFLDEANLELEQTSWSKKVTVITKEERLKKYNALKKWINSIYMKIFQVLETKFECQSICTPSPFWMTKPISAGPPTEGCVYVAKRTLDENAGTWGGFMIFLLFFIMFMICCSCSIYQHTGDDADEFTNKDGTQDAGRQNNMI